MAVKLVNESVLGVFRFSWKASTGARCEVMWCDGAAVPSFSFHLSGQGRMSPLIKIRAPERFGWRPPRKAADFMAFAQTFAEACESGEDD